MIDTLAWMAVAVTLVPAHQAARKHPGQLAALVLLELIAVALVLLAALDEPRWSALAQEDGPVEWITFLAFALAGGVFLLRGRKLGSGKLFLVACVLLALGALGIAGEEISWGQRLFGFRPPELFLSRNFQQELNLHNVLMHERGLGFALESKHLVMVIALGFSLVWPLAVGRGPLAGLAPLAPPLALLPIGLAIFAAEVSYPVELTGEGAEMLCGLLFLAAALVPHAPPRRLAAWLGGTLAGGLVISLVLSRLLFGSDDEGRVRAAAELELLRSDLEQGAVLPRMLSRNLHKRVFTAARDQYLALSAGRFLESRGTPAEPPPAGASLQVRRDRRGYFLDPWNNPYWIVFDRRARTGAVYSFGPNRRRDLRARQLDDHVGDDVVVRFALPSAAAPEPEQPEPLAP